MSTAKLLPSRMLFVQWYANKLRIVTSLPLPAAIAIQVPLWLFYGFVWIPLWYLISDKSPVAPTSDEQRETLTFSEWYAIRFSELAAAPLLVSLVAEMAMWLFYGFLWLPIWYLASDKTRPSHLSPIYQQQIAPQTTERVPVAEIDAPAIRGTGQKTERVRLNTAAETELASLPGVGPILAKKAVAFRANQRLFESLDDFAAVLGLKPHVVERLRSLVEVETIADAPLNIDTNRGRVVDF